MFSIRLYITFLVLLLLICCLSFVQSKHKPGIDRTVFEFYTKQLNRFSLSLQQLSAGVTKKEAATLLRNHFKQCRADYKNAEVLIAGLNIYAAKQLNGPALQEVEEGYADVIIEPHGLQVIETFLYPQADYSKSEAIQTEIRYMQQIVQNLLQEPDAVYKFSNQKVFEAVRQEVFRITALGITGYDTPLSSLGIADAAASLQGIYDLLLLYTREIPVKEKPLLLSLFNEIRSGIGYLKKNPDFKNFNRLYFIINHLSKISSVVSELRAHCGFIPSGVKVLVNPEAKTLFEEGAFNPLFFSHSNPNYQLNAERIALGKKLFYSNLLSSTRQRSCAGCHKPELAFTDGLPTALPLHESENVSLRNTPTLYNTVFQTKQFYDLRSSTVELQIKNVVHNRAEMNSSLYSIAEELKKDTGYSSLFASAYSKLKEPLTDYTIANAIAAYVKSLISLSSPFDKYIRGETKSLSADARAGFNLFAGKAKCATCHFIPLFNGMIPPEFSKTEAEVLGVPATPENKIVDDDEGRAGFTRIPLHRFAFKTPTLRNIALTAPYMHNGIYKTLDEVIEFYDKAGGQGLGLSVSNQTLPPEKLKLTIKEKKRLKVFLQSLTDTSAR